MTGRDRAADVAVAGAPIAAGMPNKIGRLLAGGQGLACSHDASSERRSEDAMRGARPYRSARLPQDAAAECTRMKAGRSDADVVEAVLGAAGHRVARRRDGPAGLTQREVEALRLRARGLSNE